MAPLLVLAVVAATMAAGSRKRRCVRSHRVMVFKLTLFLFQPQILQSLRKGSLATVKIFPRRHDNFRSINIRFLQVKLHR
jgi:hypothetical protein